MSTETTGIGLPKDAQLFRYSSWFMVMWLLGLLTGAAIVVSGLIIVYDSQVDMVEFVTVALLSPCGALVGGFCWDALRLAKDTIAVNDQGIWYISPRKTPLFLSWRDVVAVTDQAKGLTLKLWDLTGCRITIHHEINNFPVLREFILQHRLRHPDAAPEKMVFTRCARDLLVILGVTLGTGFTVFFALYVEEAGWLIEIVVFLAFAILAIVVFSFIPYKIAVNAESIQISCLFRKRDVAWLDISGVSLDEVSSVDGVQEQVVIVERKVGGPIRLSLAQEDSIALYDAIQWAWKRTGPA
jgi:hypothetical protein